jgi:hypothetical protein
MVNIVVCLDVFDHELIDFSFVFNNFHHSLSVRLISATEYSRRCDIMQTLQRQNRLLKYAGFAETGSKRAGAVNSRPAWTIWTGFCNMLRLGFFFFNSFVF